MIRKETVTVTLTGATGSGKTVRPISGLVLAVNLTYSGQPGTTDVTVATQDAPTVTVLTVTDANTNKWFYPRQLMGGTTGADLTGVYEPIPVADHLVISVAGGAAGSVAATIVWDDRR